MKTLSHWTEMSVPAQDGYVACQVLGYEYRARFLGDTAGYFVRGTGASLESIISEELPAYTRDLSAAAEVLWWLKKKCNSLDLSWEGYSDTWECGAWIGAQYYIGTSGSPALAICTVALRVVGKDN